MSMKDRVNRPHHRGWLINYAPNAPVTGRWGASRFGVSICADTKEALIRMIDVKVSEQKPVYPE